MNGRELIDLAFNKKKADDRKKWLSNYEVCIDFFSVSWFQSECNLFNENLTFIFFQPGTYMNNDEEGITKKNN